MVAFPGVAPSRPAFSWVKFLVDFRVVISFLLFTGLIALQLSRGLKPRVLSTADGLSIIGLLLVLVGVFFRSWSAGVVRKNCGLCVVGPYSLCRHPLYAGSFAMVVGFCLLATGLWYWPPVVATTALLYWATIRNEERRLTERFGAEWTRYAAATPMIFPGRLGGFQPGRWFAINWLRNREHRAVATALATLAILQWWRSLP